MAKRKVYLAEKSSLDSHTGNGNIHVTQSEKTKIANALTPDNVVPVTGDASLTKTIATIGGKEIKSPAGGGVSGHTVNLIRIAGGSDSDFFHSLVIKSDGTFVDHGNSSFTETDVAYVVLHHKYDSYGGSSTKPTEIIIIVDGVSYNLLTQSAYFNTNGQDILPVTIPVLKDMTIKISTATCFVKGTMVTLADGREKPCESITYDDELLVWDFDKGCLSSARPAWIKRKEIANYYFRNVLSDGTELLTTGQSTTGWGHRMFDQTRQKFVYTTQSVGDEIRTLKGIRRHVSCTLVDGMCEYYNIITAGHFNLFANGILTSCSLNNLYPISGAKFVKDGRILRPDDDFVGLERWIKPLRLRESVQDIEQLRSYVKNLELKEK